MEIPMNLRNEMTGSQSGDNELKKTTQHNTYKDEKSSDNDLILVKL